MSTPQTEPTRLHPRRRPLKTAVPSLSCSTSLESHIESSSSSPSNLRLRKGETFHSSSPPSGECDPVLSFRSLPRRSPTCPRSLEAIAAGEQRMANILGRLNLDSFDEPNQADTHDDELPVPRGFQTHMDSKLTGEIPNKRPHSPQADTPVKVRKSHCHASDSGLGTSINGSDTMSASNKSKVKAGQLSYDTKGTQSAITSSISAVESMNSQKRQLGLVACKQLERFILVPILKEERLKPFHPLVRSIPQRIVDKEIGCLRDLEKTLLWLAPHYAASRASYLGFCEFTIQCLHTSVHHLNERDQRLPADRPYTNGYFLDLVAQIRQYAAMINASRNNMNATKASAQAGEKADAPIERLTLEGGLSKNGRPAELVVHKDGEMVSLRTGKPYEENATPSFKRSLSVASVDEGVERSMARRKKNAPPMDINQKCKDCDKVFKRPCDLTKHEKTHSRPWKCTETSCKYYRLGWPTEKERDRHINDKHSNAPALYKCHFSPCSYQSKRESNCKQHMEKAHGWIYVRSKNNGRNGRKEADSATPQTPNFATPTSGAHEIPTPITNPTPSPREPFNAYPQNPPFSFADPPTQTGSDDFQLFPENNSFEDPSLGVDDFNPFPTISMDFQAFQSQLEGSDPNSLIPMDLHRQSSASSPSVPDLMATSMGFNNSPISSTDNGSLNFDMDWSHLDPQNLDEEFTTMNMQLLTPAQSVETGAMNSFSRDPSISDPSPLSFQQGKVSLYSPSIIDEAVSDLYDYQDKADFTLFEQSTNFNGGTMGLSNANAHHLSGLKNLNEMFPPLGAQDNIAYMNHSWTPEMEMDFF